VRWKAWNEYIGIPGEWQGGPLSAISYQPSAISHQLSAISYQPSAISYQPSAITYRQKVVADG
jgi:hypothetical protein